MKKAAAFLRNGKVFLHPDSRTTKGFWIFSEPVLVTGAAEKNLGLKLLTTLSHSKNGIPHPVSWKGLTNPLLKIAKVRSFDAFADDCKSVSACLDGDGLLLTPSKNRGQGNRFLHLPDKAIRCRPFEMEIERCLREAFDACE